MKKVTLEDIKNSWSNIITRLELQNSKVAHFLEDVRVHSYDGVQVFIELMNGHRFHLKTLEKDVKLVEEEMHYILGREIKIKFHLQGDDMREKRHWQGDDILVTDEWYQYYRNCASSLKKIVEILEDGSLGNTELLHETKFWEGMCEIRSIADVQDPEEMKEWLFHCRTIGRNAETKVTKKVEYDIGKYKRECIDKLKHIKVSRSLLVEDRTYQTVDWWIKEMENNMEEFQNKKFLIEAVGHNTHRIRRAE